MVCCGYSFLQAEKNWFYPLLCKDFFEKASVYRDARRADTEVSYDIKALFLLQWAFRSFKPGFHIIVSVVSVVSVVRKKFIGQIEFILSRTTRCICHFCCIESCTGGFHKVVSVL